MTNDELVDYGETIDGLADQNSHIYLFCTIGTMKEAMALLEDSWNFQYIFQMVWNKVSGNGKPSGFAPTGFPRYTHEIILVGKRGSPSFYDTRGFYTSFSAERREHSRKPREFYELIDRVSQKPIVDVFSRQNWRDEGLEIDSFGIEVDKFSADVKAGGV